MDEFHAEVTIAFKRKVLIFIRGLCLGDNRRYILQQKCAVIYLRQSKVLEEGMDQGGKGA